MNTREASTVQATQELASNIHVMDIIPDSSKYDQPRHIDIKYRTILGRAAIDGAVGSVLKSINFHVRDAEEDVYDSVQKLPVHNVPAVPKSHDAFKNIDELVAENTAEKKSRTPLTIRKALGRAAMPIKWMDSKVSALAVDVISRLPRTKSKEELYENDRLNREKFADNKDDNPFKRGYYAYRRNKIKIMSYTPVAAMGALALERFVVAGVNYDHFFDGTAFADAVPAANALPDIPQTRNIDYTPLVSKVDTIIVAGGATHGMDPGLDIADMQAKGYDLGYAAKIKGVHYSGEIGPIVGTERMDDSAAGGVTDMYNQVIGDVHAGKIVQLTAYSEGTLVAIDTYNRIVAENGGVAPANLLPPLLVATPYIKGGIMDNSFTGGLVGNVLDGMGIPTDRKLPPGTIVKYYDSDVYANGGNMNPATLIKNAIGLGMGNHDIPNEADLANVFTDSDGVIHMVYTRDDNFIAALKNAGIDIKDTDSANKMFAAFFPIGKDDTGAFLKPDVRAGLTYLATTIDHQIDPSGNLHIVQDFMNNLPDEWKDLGQKGLEGFNNIADMAGKIQAGEVDPFTGFMSIMGSISDIMGSLQGVTNKLQGSGSTTANYDWSSYSASAMANIQTGQGQDFGVQLNAIVQGFFGQYNANAQASVSVAAPAIPDSYNYNAVPQIAEQFNNYIKDVVPQTVVPTPTVAPEQLPYTPSVDASVQTQVSVPQQATLSTAPEVSAPSAAVQTTPEPVQEKAPTPAPEVYVAPTPEQAAPIVESAPAPVAAPALVVATPEPVQELAPTPPPAEVYVAPTPPPEVYQAPVVEPAAPAPVIADPIVAAPVIAAPQPAFEMPNLSQMFNIPSSGSSSSSTPSFGSSSSSSSSSPSLVTAAVGEQ